jgi:hypothetical protein
MGAHKTIELRSDLKIEQLAKEIINSAEARIVIVVPADCSLLTNEINLRLLKFYAEEEEKELFINAADPVLFSLAQRLGITTIRDGEIPTSNSEPVLASTEYSGDSELTMVSTAQPPRSIINKNIFAAKLLPALIVLLFTFILAFWWFLQPKVLVLVYPKEQTITFKTNAEIGIAFSDGDITAGKLPAKNLQEQCKLITQIATTGHKTVGVTPAIGKVLAINNSNQPVLLPKGTILSGRAGMHFITDKDILVPKKSTKLESGIVVGENYGKAEIPVTAEKKGVIGNQPAKSITGIEAKYQNLLRVANPAPTFNGADKQIAVVALEDVKKAEAEVKRQMELAVNDEAQGLVTQDYLYIPDMVKAEITHITNKPEIGAEADSLETELEYRINILAPTMVGVNKYLNQQFDQNIPANFEAKNRKLALISKRVISFDEGLASIEMMGQGQIRGVLDQNKIKSLIRGQSIARAKEILARQNEIADVRFKVDNLRAKLPSFGFQIKILFPAGSKANYRL